MSRFFSKRLNRLVPYTPGEQPKDQQYVKLNTNESPFPPSPKAMEEAIKEEQRLQLYPDPDVSALREAFCVQYPVRPDQVVFSNGSDDLLNFAFIAFCDDETPAYFPDITYGFYPVFADINRIDYTEIPLDEALRIDPKDYVGRKGTVFLANPNAPTGCILSVSEIEDLVEKNKDSVFVIDEAYVDFGAESCIPLVSKHDNILIIGTFSKSRSFAGGRLGFAVGCESLIADLNTIRYSTNPYNINRLTIAAGIGILNDPDYMRKNARTIIENRAWTTEKLRELGFELTDSYANFVFAKSSWIGGEKLYLELKKRGVLVRHFSKPRIEDYLRITIGTREQMQILIDRITEIKTEEES